MGVLWVMGLIGLLFLFMRQIDGDWSQDISLYVGTNWLVPLNQPKQLSADTYDTL